jgi:hypothetical protein
MGPGQIVRQCLTIWEKQIKKPHVVQVGTAKSSAMPQG